MREGLSLGNSQCRKLEKLSYILDSYNWLVTCEMHKCCIYQSCLISVHFASITLIQFKFISIPIELHHFPSSDDYKFNPFICVHVRFTMCIGSSSSCVQCIHLRDHFHSLCEVSRSVLLKCVTQLCYPAKIITMPLLSVFCYRE